TMREPNFSFPGQNRAAICITSTIYDRRALDCTDYIPIINTLTNLAYLTGSTPTIREFITRDGGLERLVTILKNTKANDRKNGLKWTLAFQCVVNIGVRGTEQIRKRVVQAGMVPVIVNVLESFFAVLKSVNEENEKKRQQRRADTANSQSLQYRLPQPQPSNADPNGALEPSGSGQYESHPHHHQGQSDEGASSSSSSSSSITSSSVPPSLTLTTTATMSTTSLTPTTMETGLGAYVQNGHPFDSQSIQVGTTSPSGHDLEAREATQSGLNQQESRPQQQFFYREDDILHSLQLLAYLSKYPTLRSSFHTDSGSNVFAIVEKFTHRTMHPLEIQYWAGVIMRNACRKDDTRKGIRQCAYTGCGKWETKPREFAKCRRCRKAKYCSKQCQSKAWSEGHRWWCIEKKPESMGVSTSFGTDLPPAPPPPPPPADLQDQPEGSPSLMENGSIPSIPTGAGGPRIVGGGGENGNNARHQGFHNAQYQQVTGFLPYGPRPIPGQSAGQPSAVSQSQSHSQTYSQTDSQTYSMSHSQSHPEQMPQRSHPAPHSQAQSSWSAGQFGYPPNMYQQHPSQNGLSSSQRSQPQGAPSHAHAQQPPHQRYPQEQVRTHHQQSGPQSQPPSRPQGPLGTMQSRPLANAPLHAPSAAINPSSALPAAPMPQRSMSHRTPNSAPLFPTQRSEFPQHLGISPDSPTPEQLAQRFVQQVALHPGQHNELAQSLSAQFKQYFPTHHQAEAKRQFSFHARQHFARYEREQQILRNAAAQNAQSSNVAHAHAHTSVAAPTAAPGPSSSMSGSKQLTMVPGASTAHGLVTATAGPKHGMTTNAPGQAIPGKQSGTARRRSDLDSDEDEERARLRSGPQSTSTMSMPMLTQDLSTTELSGPLSTSLLDSNMSGQGSFGPSSGSLNGADAVVGGVRGSPSELRDFKVRKLMTRDDPMGHGSASSNGVSNHATTEQGDEWSYSRQMAKDTTTAS
ncbi:hypothetical protein BGW38_004415, partial [Lunasporangiospora selenospora]